MRRCRTCFGSADPFKGVVRLKVKVRDERGAGSRGDPVSIMEADGRRQAASLFLTSEHAKKQMSFFYTAASESSRWFPWQPEGSSSIFMFAGTGG